MHCRDSLVSQSAPTAYYAPSSCNISHRRKCVLHAAAACLGLYLRTRLASIDTLFVMRSCVSVNCWG